MAFLTDSTSDKVKKKYDLIPIVWALFHMFTSYCKAIELIHLFWESHQFSGHSFMHYSKYNWYSLPLAPSPVVGVTNK